MQQPVVSLFDESGIMVRPWAERGFQCYCFDIQNDGRVEQFASGGSITYAYADLMPDDWRVEGSTSATIEAIIALNPYIVFGFGPCDDLAVCGSKHFAGKLADDPDCQLRAVALWRVVETVGLRTGAPWFGENPRSRGPRQSANLPSAANRQSMSRLKRSKPFGLRRSTRSAVLCRCVRLRSAIRFDWSLVTA